MTLYNLFLNTKTGSKLAHNPSNEGFLGTLRFICEIVEAIGMFFLIGGAVTWSYDMSPSALSMIVVFSLLAGYIMLRFTVGNKRYGDYLLLRAKHGLVPDEKSLSNYDESKPSWFETRNNAPGTELSTVVSNSSTKEYDGNGTFDIDGDVIDQWKKELEK